MTVNEFISALSVHFPVKHTATDREELWLASMHAKLSRFQPEALQRAADAIIDTRKHGSFPLPSDCLEACEKAERLLAMREAARELGALRDPLDDWSPKRVAIAYDLVKCTLGRQAAREGWLLGLWNFCRAHGCHPNGDQVTNLKRTAVEFKRLVVDCRRGEQQIETKKRKSTFVAIGDCSRSFAKLGMSMLAKEQRIAAGL